MKKFRDSLTFDVFAKNSVQSFRKATQAAPVGSVVAPDLETARVLAPTRFPACGPLVVVLQRSPRP